MEFPIPDWVLGLSLLVLTTILLVSAFGPTARLVARMEKLDLSDRVKFFLIVGVSSYAVTSYAIIAAAIWAALFMAVGASANWHDAMIYSLEAVTCYGHVNVFLKEPWELLGAIEAVNGLILFGMITAFLISALQRVWPAQLK